jgi:hypothetical protein
MKELLCDAQQEEARSYASPVKSTIVNRSVDIGVKKNVIF